MVNVVLGAVQQQVNEWVPSTQRTLTNRSHPHAIHPHLAHAYIPANPVRPQ